MTERLTVPPAWEILGELPSILATEDLVEDIVQLRSRSGDFTIDVGWSPPLDPDGHFVCKLVERDDWDFPVEEMTTKKLDAVRRWIADAVDLYSDRLAAPDTMQPLVNVIEDSPAKAFPGDGPNAIDLTSAQTIQQERAPIAA
jgi:hypothetical protein